MRIAVALLFVLWAFLLAASCQPAAVDTAMPEEVTPSETAVPVLPTQEGTERMTPPLPTAAEPGLQNLIKMTTQDLADRLSVAPDEISLVEAMPVEWSDSSLDCPQEGMSYLPVITPGYRIVLQANGQTYAYHTNRAAYFVLCNNRLPPIIPRPTG